MRFLRQLWRLRRVLREHAEMKGRLDAIEGLFVSEGSRIRSLAEVDGLLADALLLHDVIAGRRPLAVLFDAIRGVFGEQVHRSWCDQAAVYLAAMRRAETSDADTAEKGRTDASTPERFVN